MTKGLIKLNKGEDNSSWNLSACKASSLAEADLKAIFK